jgi:flagellar biosynthesis anti-sigma factor FlgM
MKVSREQIEAIRKERQAGGFRSNIATGGALNDRDLQLLAELKQQLKETSDVREELVLEIKARIERGEYHPDANEIADAMIRRAIADQSAQ